MMLKGCKIKIDWDVLIFGSHVEPRKTQSEFMPNLVKQERISLGIHDLLKYV